MIFFVTLKLSQFYIRTAPVVGEFQKLNKPGNIPLLAEGINILDASAYSGEGIRSGQAYSPPQLRRGGCALNKKARSHLVPRRRGGVDQSPLIC